MILVFAELGRQYKAKQSFDPVAATPNMEYLLVIA